MSCYFFHQIYGETRLVDPDGECFPSIDVARVEAVISARHLMGAALSTGKLPRFGKIEICDESGAVLEEITFMDALGLGSR